MSIALGHHWQMLLLTNPSPVELSATAGVGGWACPIYMSIMCIDVPLYQGTKRAPISASIALAMMFLMVVHLT